VARWSKIAAMIRYLVCALMTAAALHAANDNIERWGALKSP